MIPSLIFFKKQIHVEDGVDLIWKKNGGIYNAGVDEAFYKNSSRQSIRNQFKIQ